MSLRDALRATGLSQTELARRLGCSQALISRLLSGERRVSDRMRRRIVQVFPGLWRLAVDELLDEVSGRPVTGAPAEGERDDASVCCRRGPQ